MNFLVYTPLSEHKPDFPSNLVTAFTAVESYEYCRNWQDIGEFTLTIPIDTVGVENIKGDMILVVEDDYNTDSLVITSIIDSGKNVILKGFDLKVMMKWRVTLFPDEEFDKGTYGYDVAQGITGQIIQHYIERNFINPRDQNRKIFGLRADNLGGGITNDTYMSRMEPVNEVIQKLCKNADIGYDIIAAANGYHVVIQEGTDRTNKNTTFGKVVIADFTMDADDITVETNTADRGNIVWAVNGGDADTATVIAVDNSATDSNGNIKDPYETEGFNRREIVTTTNCDIDEIQIYAQKSSENKVNKTAIKFELKDYTMFINRFYVGDKITVLKCGKEYNKRVLSANKRYDGNSKTISITLGDVVERKPLKKLFYNSYKNKQDIIDEKLKNIEETKKPVPSPSPSSILSQVSFEKNRLFYNGEAYHLQFGWNKRIMCVTKGNKYAIINSQDYTGSRIEAATAVMNGLTEDWDLQFDYFGNMSPTYGQTLSVSDIIDYSGAVKCDWGDGTVDNELSHTYYNMRDVVVKIKLLGETGDISNIGMSAFGNWESFDNKLFHEQGIGIRLYIGGSIKGVQFGDWYDSLNCVSFGESVKIVKGQRSTPDSRLNKPYEIGIPPFVETIGHYAYIYSSSAYIYIPESCRKIESYAFYMNGAREIEIEEKGGAIEIGAGCFSHASNEYCFGKTVSAKIPSRVTFDYSQGNEGIFYRNATDSLYIGSGITDIPYILCNYAEVGNDKFSDIELNRPYFIFIPNTVKTIGASLVCTARPTYIICEGNWSNITKDSSWNYNSGSDNIKIINDGYLYKNADTVLEYFVRGK